MSDTCTIPECVSPKNEVPGAGEWHLQKRNDNFCLFDSGGFAYGGTDTVGLRWGELDSIEASPMVRQGSTVIVEEVSVAD